jgi:quinol monooxygenase YgiN
MVNRTAIAQTREHTAVHGRRRWTPGLGKEKEVRYIQYKAGMPFSRVDHNDQFVRKYLLKEDCAMWAQLIKTRLRPGKEEEFGRISEQLRAIEQPDSGLLRTMTMRDQKDPNALYTMVVFESEEKARAREQDPRRREGLQGIQAQMAQLFEGPLEFVDLDVVEEAAT